MYDGKTGVDPTECVVHTVKGQSVVFEGFDQNPNGTSYVRFIDDQERELLYYSMDEWQEDPEMVMGCIMSCIQNGASTIARE